MQRESGLFTVLVVSFIFESIARANTFRDKYSDVGIPCDESERVKFVVCVLICRMVWRGMSGYEVVCNAFFGEHFIKRNKILFCCSTDLPPLLSLPSLPNCQPLTFPPINLLTLFSFSFSQPTNLPSFLLNNVFPSSLSDLPTSSLYTHLPSCLYQRYFLPTCPLSF